MSRRKPQIRGPRESEEILSAAQKGLSYVKPYAQWLIMGGVILIVALLAWSGYSFFQHSREARAQAALDKARPNLSQPDKAEDALKTLNTVIQDYPSTRAALMARLYKGHLLYQTQKYAEAATAYEEALSTSGNEDLYGWNPMVTESLSYCYEAQGEFGKAAQTLKPLVDMSSGNYQTVLQERLALLYDKAGKKKEAEDIWQRLLISAHNPALLSYWKEKLAASQQKAEPEKDTGKN
ncbi:MAG: tetratricopeptide repeat protein [Desulfobaccales bacterium]